jgi:TIR domain
MPTIMLSYRRDDSKWVAGRIFDRLEDHYGKGNVYMDIDAIPVGFDFREHLQHSLQRCDILLAIVGPRWLGTDEHGHHAIAEETDWVRIEIETALAKNIPVIPVLIDRLRMPKAADLPESLRNFAFRQAAEVDSGVDFRSHLDRLIRSMDHYLQGLSAVPSTISLAPIEKQDTPVPIQESDLRSSDTKEIQPTRAGEAVEFPSGTATAPDLPLLKFLRLATSSWIAIGSLLVASELLAVLSEQAATDDDRALFIMLTALPLGATGLIGIGRRILAHLTPRDDKNGTVVAISLLGFVLVAAVPTFFHITHPPDQYAAAAAWPLVLLGGFGVLLIVDAIICDALDTAGRSRSLKVWIVIGIILLAFAWLDSGPTSTFFPILDWRVRSVLIFTCVLIGSAIFVALASCAVLLLGRNISAKGVGLK